MSEALNYRTLALDWQSRAMAPDYFKWITLTILVLVIALAFWVASVTVPQKQRQAIVVPERIANFIAERPRKIEPPAPIPEPPPARPVQKKSPPPVTPPPQPQVTVERKRPLEQDNKPLTAREQQARQVAQTSGLLALASEMNDLTDTAAVSHMARAKIREDRSATATADHDAIKIAATTAENRVDVSKLRTELQETTLEERSAASQVTAATENALKEAGTSAEATGAATAGRTADVLSKVFSANRANLYALYERERRKNASLKGKVVFQLTITPNGKVSAVKILSSELKNPSLEARLMSRIKLFTFPPTTETTTIEYPVEFLP